MKGDDIADPLLLFSAAILGLCAGLPPTPEGRHVRRQLTRCGTAGGANYEEARSSESPADFAHKVLIAAKEVRESIWWLKLISRVGLNRHSSVAALATEGNELVAILCASARTARERASAR